MGKLDISTGWRTDDKAGFPPKPSNQRKTASFVMLQKSLQNENKLSVRGIPH